MEKRDLWIKCGGNSLGVYHIDNHPASAIIVQAIEKVLMEILSEDGDVIPVEGGRCSVLMLPGQEEPK